MLSDIARSNHQCVLLKNPEGDRPTVVVYGGRDTTDSLIESSEFWDLETHEITEPTDPKYLSSDSNTGPLQCSSTFF